MAESSSALGDVTVDRGCGFGQIERHVGIGDDVVGTLDRDVLDR